MKCCLIILFALFSIFLHAQDPDILAVTMVDSPKSIEQFVVKISFAKKNKTNFQFPVKYSIGGDSNPIADIILELEKKTNQQFAPFMCRYVSVHHDIIDTDTITYKNWRELVIVDSLESLFCLTKGDFRLRARYNKRNPDGKFDAPNFIVSSPWAYFYVSDEEVILRRYYRKETSKSVY